MLAFIRGALFSRRAGVTSFAALNDYRVVRLSDPILMRSCLFCVYFKITVLKATGDVQSGTVVLVRQCERKLGDMNGWITAQEGWQCGRARDASRPVWKCLYWPQVYSKPMISQLPPALRAAAAFQGLYNNPYWFDRNFPPLHSPVLWKLVVLLQSAGLELH